VVYAIEYRRRESEGAEGLYNKIETGMRFGEFSGCFWCGVRQEMCSRWEDNRKGRYRMVEGGSCQYDGVLTSGILGIAGGRKEQVFDRWSRRLEEFGVSIVSEKDVIKYLGQKRRAKDIESNNLAGKFCWITRLVEE
jgi:hypothetical protein